MGDPTLIQSVQRALRLLEVLAERDGRARAKELARAAGLPLATTYHLLRTCAHEGWLQRLDDGSYVLGHRIDVVRQHGTAARGLAHARPALEWLRDELGGAVYLARFADGEIVVTEIVDSARAPRIDLWVGMHDAAHATALGKSILGQLTAADRARLPRAPPAARPHAAHRRRPAPAAAARGRARSPWTTASTRSACAASRPPVTDGGRRGAVGVRSPGCVRPADRSAARARRSLTAAGRISPVRWPLGA